MFQVLRPLFGWKFTSAIGLLFLSSGIGAMLSDKFVWAIFFYAVAGAWLIGSWLTAHPVPRPFTENRRRKIRRRWTGVAVIGVLILCVCFYEYEQMDLFNRTQYVGRLTPANDPVEPVCNLPPFLNGAGTELPSSVTAVYLRNNRFAASHFPYSPLMYEKKPVFTIDQDEKGRVGITVDIRDKDGKIVARIQKGKFEVNRNNIFSMERPDDSTLIIDDQYGNEVLNLRYRNKRVIKFLGTLYLEGRKVPIRISDEELDTGGPTKISQTCATYSPDQHVEIPIPTLPQ